MRNLKFNFQFIALIAIVAFAFVLSAFKPQTNSLDPVWFEYDGTGDVYDSENYVPMENEPTCDADEQICAIKAEPSGSEPIIDKALSDEIAAALSTPTVLHPNVRLLQ